MVHVTLHKGFYCFVGYCIFSTAGALLIEKPEEHSIEERRRLFSGIGPTKQTMLSAVGGSIVMLAFLVTLSRVPILNVKCSMLSLNEHLSFAHIIENLGENGYHLAAMVVLMLAFLLPAADFVWAVVEATLGRVEHPLGEWLMDLAMFDVFALAVIITASAADGLSESLNVSILPGGKLFIVFGAAWVLYSLTSRPAAVACSLPAKDKSVASPVDSSAESDTSSTPSWRRHSKLEKA